MPPLPRPFWFLWWGTLLNRLGMFVSPFLALYLTGARGYSVTEAGLVLTLLGAGAAVSQPLGGVVADRAGRRRTLVGGLLASATALLGVGLARSLPTLCVAAFLYGLCLDVFRPAASAAVADIVGPEQRQRAFALVFWAVNLGFALSAPLGGLIAERGFWLLFALDAATSVGFAGLVLRGVPESRPAPDPHQPAASLARVLGDPLLVALVAGTVLQAVVYMQAYSTLPLAFARDHLGPAAYGLALTTNGVLIVVAQPLLVRRLRNRAAGPLLLASALLMGAGFGLTAFADSVPQHVGAIAVWTAGEVLAAGLLSTVVAGIAPAAARGRYLGVYGASFGIAALLAPLVGTQVLARLGEPALWGGCLGLDALSGVVLYRVAAAATRRTAVTPVRS